MTKDNYQDGWEPIQRKYRKTKAKGKYAVAYYYLSRKKDTCYTYHRYMTLTAANQAAANRNLKMVGVGAGNGARFYWGVEAP